MSSIFSLSGNNFESCFCSKTCGTFQASVTCHKNLKNSLTIYSVPQLEKLLHWTTALL